VVFVVWSKHHKTSTRNTVSTVRRTVIEETGSFA
jgi:hypothetical protein